MTAPHKDDCLCGFCPCPQMTTTKTTKKPVRCAALRGHVGPCPPAFIRNAEKRGPAESAIQGACMALASMLVAKNRAYGNSALEPVRVFSKASPQEQILVRLDDKLSRLARGSDFPGEDTIADLAGYLILLQISNKRQNPANGRNPGYYAASSLNNAAEVQAFNARMDGYGHGPTYDWTHHGAVFRDGLGVICETAQRELAGIYAADYVVVLLTDDKQRGTHVELGYALALGKPVYVLAPHSDLFLATPSTCAFYHHPNVTQVAGDLTTLITTILKDFPPVSQP